MSLKNYVTNQNLNKKFMLPALVAMIFTLFLGLYSLYTNYQEKQIINKIDNAFTWRNECGEQETKLVKIHAGIYKLVSWGSAKYDTNKIQGEGNKYLSELSAVKNNITKISNLATNKQEKELFALLEKDLITYENSAKGVVEMTVANDDATATMFISTLDTMYDSLLSSFGKLNNIIKNDIKTVQYNAVSSTTRNTIITIIAICAVLIFSFLSGNYIAKLTIEPIRKIIDTIKDISQNNDLTKRVELSTNDEFQEMIEELNGFFDKLHRILEKTYRSNEKVSETTENIKRFSDNLTTNITDLTQQAMSVAAASEEMALTSSEIAKNCVMAVKSAEATEKVANDGNSIIMETVEAMQKLKITITDYALLIEEIGNESANISKILDLINDIADQTNLLALNAAIEAARAGEHGRGFAVVADEVRKLAEKTVSAIKEIENTVINMKNKTQQAVKTTKQEVERINSTSEKTENTGMAFNNILKEIHIVSGEINQIATAVEEQTATTEDIAKNINNVSNYMTETNNMTDNNKKIIGELAASVVELKKEIQQFKF